MPGKDLCGPVTCWASSFTYTCTCPWARRPARSQAWGQAEFFITHAAHLARSTPLAAGIATQPPEARPAVHGDNG